MRMSLGELCKKTRFTDPLFPLNDYSRSVSFKHGIEGIKNVVALYLT